MDKPQSKKKQDNLRLKAALDLYDNAPCGSICFQSDGLIFDINNTLAAWLGYRKEEIINIRTLPSLFKIGGKMFFETHFFPLIKLQGFIKEVYFDMIRKDKTVLHGLINVREIPSQDHQPSTFQATVLDMSDRWRFETELLKAKQKAESDSKAKADFLSTISHEIRTPLNAILGIGNLLHKTPLNKNQKDYARLLLHSSEHLLSLVNNLLDLSKIEAKKIELEYIDFDIIDLTSMLKQTFSVRAKEKGIEMVMIIEKDVPRYLIGDPLKLNQILTNLIGNAIKFTKKGAVTLSIAVVKSDKEKVALGFKVTDTGIGIPAEKLELIFQEFSQASYDVNIEFGGTGLGLTISQKLLELYGSKLSVSSTLNVGSEFDFRISYATSNKKIQKDDFSLLLDKELNFGNLQVLLVDDNPANLFIAEQYLEQWNIAYQSAESGLKALNILEKNTFDLVLLDLQMPKMNGYETAKKIRELSLKKSPTIVAFSASTKGEVHKQLSEAGIDDHLPKPFQPKQLYEILIRHQGSSLLIEVPKSKKKPVQKKVKSIKKLKIKAKKNKSFNLDRYRKMAKNKPEYLNKFRMSTLNALFSYQKDYNKAIKKKDLQMISDLIHTSTMSLYYIEAVQLSELLKESRSILQQEVLDEALLTNKVIECNNEFKIIMKGLQEEI